MKRRPVSPFSLSFLDIMFCGFGAVVLLVLILNTDTVKARNQTFADLRGVPGDPAPGGQVDSGHIECHRDFRTDKRTRTVEKPGILSCR